MPSGKVQFIQEKSPWFKIGLVPALLALLMVCSVLPALASSPLNHNSNTTGSSKWPKLGNYSGWGIPGGKYGEFVCATCHNRTTDNIKRVTGSIPNFIGFSTADGSAKPVVFLNTTGAITSFGNDADNHVTSTRICEACHTQTLYHRYDTTGQSNTAHSNTNDCTACHPHSVGFKPLGCTGCHGGAAGSDQPFTTNSSDSDHYSPAHVAHTNNASVIGTNFQCQACHAQTVGSSDTTIISATHRDGYYN